MVQVVPQTIQWAPVVDTFRTDRLRLVESIERYRGLPQRANRHGRLDHAAWVARNLPKLRIRADYCGKSPENADDFSCHTVRDIAGMLRNLEMAAPEIEAELPEAKAFIGSTGPHHKFKPGSQAAEEFGIIKDSYEKNCKVLSKFLRPTAVSVLTTFRGQRRKGGGSCDRDGWYPKQFEVSTG